MSCLLHTNDVFKILKRTGIIEDIADLDTLWVVTATELSGGGTGHGSHDVYPDGHGVTALQVDETGEPTGKKLFFYQTGCFNGMLKPKHVRIVGKAKPRYSLNLK